MKTKNKIADEAKELFMYDRDAAAFLGVPIGGHPLREFDDELEAITYLSQQIRNHQAKVVFTDTGNVLWRLDWLLDERARRHLEPPQLLCNRNTGVLNRVRAEGRIFKVKPCKDVLVGDDFLFETAVQKSAPTQKAR